VQIRHAQLFQVRNAPRHAIQVATELLHIGAVAEHALVEEPAWIGRALCVLRVQCRRALGVQPAQRLQQVAEPGIETGMAAAVAVQAGQQPVQHRAAGGQALRRRRAQLVGKDRQQAVGKNIRSHGRLLD